jgi:DNA polymerase-1
MSVVALIDADIVMYRAVSFVETEFEGSPVADWRQGVRIFDDFLTRWLAGVKLSDYRLVFTKGRNFRKEFYPEYKANRKLLTTWDGMWDMRADLLDLLVSEYEDGIEADDVLGIHHTKDPEGTVIVSADKDFQTIPGRLYVPASHGKTSGTWYETTEPEANLNWFRQALTGDVTDNYFGIKGIGPAKAAKILPETAPIPALWRATRDAFKAAGHTEDYALTMVRLARILRHGDYDWKSKEIKLWTPSA